MGELAHSFDVESLEWTSHPSGFGQRAVVVFPNGFKASVVTGSGFYSSNERPYEIGVMDGGGLRYDTPITDDVLGYLTTEEANEALRDIAALPPTDNPAKKE